MFDVLHQVRRLFANSRVSELLKFCGRDRDLMHPAANARALLHRVYVAHEAHLFRSHFQHLPVLPIPERADYKLQTPQEHQHLFQSLYHC